MKGTTVALLLALMTYPGLSCKQEGKSAGDDGGAVDGSSQARDGGAASSAGSGAGSGAGVGMGGNQAGSGAGAGAGSGAGGNDAGEAQDASGGAGAAGQSDASGSSGGAAAGGGTGAAGGGDAATFKCPAAALGARLGRDRLLLGGSMGDSDFASAPFDLRYLYLAGAVPADGPCDSCATDCQVNGQSCANSAGCDWWGCWQYDQDPPGRYVAFHVQNTVNAGAIPMISYYVWYSVAGSVEGAAEVAALDNAANVAAYLADIRFVCRILNEPPAPAAILQLEPDLWGYGHQVNDNPDLIPAAVSAAGAAECSGFSDSMAGLARCMLAIARAEAPNVLVGFHASAWGAGHDALINADPGFDLADHATRTASFMRELGAAEADLVVVEMSDRDAGYNDRWWDETDTTLPHFEQAISWAATLGEELNLPLLWWQVPYGQMGLENAPDRYQDNRVDYFFDHPDRFALGGALGIAFGAGAGGMTTPATDDGHFLQRADQYFASDRPLLCGD